MHRNNICKSLAILKSSWIKHFNSILSFQFPLILCLISRWSTHLCVCLSLSTVFTIRHIEPSEFTVWTHRSEWKRSKEAFYGDQWQGRALGALSKTTAQWPIGGELSGGGGPPQKPALSCPPQRKFLHVAVTLAVRESRSYPRRSSRPPPTPSNITSSTTTGKFSFTAALRPLMREETRGEHDEDLASLQPRQVPEAGMRGRSRSETHVSMAGTASYKALVCKGKKVNSSGTMVVFSRRFTRQTHLPHVKSASYGPCPRPGRKRKSRFTISPVWGFFFGRQRYKSSLPVKLFKHSCFPSTINFSCTCSWADTPTVSPFPFGVKKFKFAEFSSPSIRSWKAV